MSKVVKQMIKKINWLAWLVLVILWNYGFPNTTPLQDVIVAVILSILFIIIQNVQSRGLQNRASKVNLKINEGTLNMGIHYDYKSTRGDKAMKKEAKRKAKLSREEPSVHQATLKSPRQN